MRLLLRTLTRKSVIGFGNFKNTTVQNLLNQRNYIDLISMYYNLDLISFSNDVLEELNLVDYRAIAKPGKNTEIFKQIGSGLAEQLRNIHGFFKPENYTINPMDNYRRRADRIRRNKEKSKMLNKIRVQ